MLIWSGPPIANESSHGMRKDHEISFARCNYVRRLGDLQLESQDVEKILGEHAMENQLTCAFNRTRDAFVATNLRIADTHWTRLKGLLDTPPAGFDPGRGLWIVPCHGVHTLAMRYAIDVVFLDENLVVVHLEENVKPWRVTPVRTDAASVLELPSHTICNTQTQIGDAIEIHRLGTEGSGEPASGSKVGDCVQ